MNTAPAVSRVCTAAWLSRSPSPGRNFSRMVTAEVSAVTVPQPPTHPGSADRPVARPHNLSDTGRDVLPPASSPAGGIPAQWCAPSDGTRQGRAQGAADPENSRRKPRGWGVVARQRRMGGICKTVGSAYDGSNPSPATQKPRSEPLTRNCVSGSGAENERFRRPLLVAVGHTWARSSLLLCSTHRAHDTL